MIAAICLSTICISLFVAFNLSEGRLLVTSLLYLARTLGFQTQWKPRCRVALAPYFTREPQLVTKAAYTSDSRAYGTQSLLSIPYSLGIVARRRFDQPCVLCRKRLLQEGSQAAVPEAKYDFTKTVGMRRQTASQLHRTGLRVVQERCGPVCVLHAGAHPCDDSRVTTYVC